MKKPNKPLPASPLHLAVGMTDLLRQVLDRGFAYPIQVAMEASNGYTWIFRNDTPDRAPVDVQQSGPGVEPLFPLVATITDGKSRTAKWLVGFSPREGRFTFSETTIV